MTENRTQISASPRTTVNFNKNKHQQIPFNENTIHDDYEEEFERIMQEHENQQICHTGIDSDNSDINIARTTPNFVTKVEKTSSNIYDACSHNLKKPAKIVITCNTNTASVTRSDVQDYPSELNPFAENEEEKGKGTNPFGDSDDEGEKGQSTNPFGEDDDEQTSPITVVIPPQPKPRRSVSTTRPGDTDMQGRGPHNRDKMPIPLPRTLSKSMPSTPNQSPLLRINRSFRLPGSGSSLSGSNASTYNSIRRKKNPAPPPPPQSTLLTPPRNTLPTLSAQSQSPTTNRPRKARMAPPPPKPGTNKVDQEISPSNPNESI